MATKKFSPAQLAAQKLFAERARSGTLKKGKRKTNPGLYENINAKKKRIAAGSGEKMRKPGEVGRPTAQAFIDSAKTAKRNPANETVSVYKTPSGKIAMKIQYSETNDTFSYIGEYGAGSGSNYSQMKKDVLMMLKYHPRVKLASGEDFITLGDPIGARKRNPDKAKPRAYVKRVSQATGAPPSKRLVTRRKMALKAPAGYFPNPKTGAMMTGYQVICMHPKQHVVGIFKTMAEAKQIATAMANAKGVAYAVKTVKVHKAHFAV